MVLNWTIEVLVDLVVGLIGFFCVLLTYKVPKARNITSLAYIRFGIIFVSLFILFEGFGDLLLVSYLKRISLSLLFPAAICFIIGMNYAMKESFNSISLILMFSLGIVLCILAFQPGAVVPITGEGYLSYESIGIFSIMVNIYLILTILFIFLWGLRTWRNAPFLIRKEANLFFLGIISCTIVSTIVYFFIYLIPVVILISTISLGIGMTIFNIAIVREPKLLYILPFTIYRITVRDQDGFPLFDHDWSSSDISETVFSGFLNAIQLMSEKVLRIGDPMDIRLEEGNLILRQSEFITVGLVASNSSKLLTESVSHFSVDFEERFKILLQQSCKDKKEYATAYDLIEKYFSNFHYNIVRTAKSPLLLSMKIPLELENKLKDIFADEKEIEFIKSEISKSPLGVTSEFLDLYNELKEEISFEEEEVSKI